MVDMEAMEAIGAVMDGMAAAGATTTTTTTVSGAHGTIIASGSVTDVSKRGLWAASRSAGLYT
jgi:hypothetical protein